MYTKELLNKDGVSVTVSEEAGVVALTLAVGESLGGGVASGVATVSASMKATISAAQIIDLGFSLAEAKFPSVAALLKEAQALIDAELKNA